MDLITSRARLRRLETTDLQNLFSLESDAAVVKHTRIRTPRTLEQTQQRLNEQIARTALEAPLGIWVAEFIDSKKFIGWFMLLPKPERSAELGYMIVQELWGQGLATEVCRCLIEAGFYSVNLSSIQAVTDDTNPASERILHKLGFQNIRNDASENAKYFEFKNQNWQPRLQGTIVNLEPLKEEHFESVYLAASDPLIWELHPNPLRYQRDVFRKFFDSGMQKRGALLVRRVSDGAVIGSSSFYEYSLHKRSVVIGFTFLVRECWGGDFNKEVKKLMMTYAFQYVDSIFFDVDSLNFRSQKAVQKIGGRLHLKFEEFDSNGRSVMTFRYQIQRTEFELNPFWR